VTDASLTGRLLVASPVLGDPNFERSVVLLVDHDVEGALGVVLNRPTSVAVGAVVPAWGEYTTGPATVFRGGPVGEDSALGLGALATAIDSDADEPDGFRRLFGSIGLIDLEAEPAALAGELRAVRVFAGYAGWGPGQLEDELAEQAWFVVDSLPGDAFSTDPAQLWRDVLRRQGGDLALVSSFPDDPSMN